MNKQLNTLINTAILVLCLIALILGYAIFLFFIDILRIIAISLFVSYLCYPAFKFLNKFIKKPIISILVIYSLLIVIFIISSIIIIPEVYNQFYKLFDNLQSNIPNLISGLKNRIAFLSTNLSANFEMRTLEKIENLMEDSVFKLDPQSIIGQISIFAGSTIMYITNTVTVMIMSFYLLLDSKQLMESANTFIPIKYQDTFKELMNNINQTVSAFFQGQIILSSVFSLVLMIIMFALGVHYILAITAFLVFWEIVPVIGPPIGFIPIAISVLLKGMDNIHTGRFSQFIIIFLIFNSLQWIKDNILAPKYVGHKIGLHPILIILAIIIGSKFDGLCGIIMALPIAAALSEVINFIRNNKLANTKIHYD